MIDIQTTWLDYPDNESLAVIVYISGCIHNCFGCHNPEFQNFDNNESIFSVNYLKQIRQMGLNNRTNKIVLSGGDPIYDIIENRGQKIQTAINFLTWLDYEICIYTGYNIEQIKEHNITGFKFIKCEKYDENLKQQSIKTDEYIQFSSTNQKLYDSQYELLSDNGKYYFKGDK